MCRAGLELYCSAAMSVAGIDIGSSKACIAVARKRGIDVLMNKTSKRVRAAGAAVFAPCFR